MAKQYVIRKIAFHYSDEHLYFHTTGVIQGNIFTNYQEAHNTLMDLERQAYISIDLGDIEPFSGSSSGVIMHKMIQLKYYLEIDLGLNLLKLDEYGRISADRDTYLTKDITNEQIERIRYLSGLKFFELIEFEDEPQFFGIWKKKPFYKNEGFIEAGTYGGQQKGSICFYNSYMDAFNEAIKHCPDDLSEDDLSGTEIKIKGKLEEIADVPIIFQALIKPSNTINYDESSEILTFKYISMMDKEWASICTLLKNKPFEIRLLSFNDVKDCEQWAYESM